MNNNRQTFPTKLPKWSKLLIEYGPICVFFIAYLTHGLFAATLAMIIGTIVALSLSYIFERRVPSVALFSAAVILVFGGLTLWLRDETFIKMKPTIIQFGFGLVLLIGLYTNNIFLKNILSSSVNLTKNGWDLLTRRLAYFFFFMAVLNEVIWRTQSTDFWVNFKVFGILTLTMLFLIVQFNALKKHLIAED